MRVPRTLLTLLTTAAALAATPGALASDDARVASSQARVKGALEGTRLGDETIGDLFLELESVASGYELPAGPFDPDPVVRRVHELLAGRGVGAEERAAMVGLVVERVRIRHSRVSPLEAAHVQVKVALAGTPLTDSERGEVFLRLGDVAHAHAGAPPDDPALLEDLESSVVPQLAAAGLTPAQQHAVLAWVGTWADAAASTPTAEN